MSQTATRTAILVGYCLLAGLGLPRLWRRGQRGEAIAVGAITTLALALAVGESLMNGVPRICSIIGPLFRHLVPESLATSLGLRLP